jgi:transcriptional regulator with XRE-family HTH domain/transposase-like protein
MYNGALLIEQVVNIGSTLGVGYRMWTQEEKLQIVLLCLEQNIPTKVLSKRFGVNRSMVYVWCKQYAEYGANWLKPQDDTSRLQLTTSEKEQKMKNNHVNLNMDASVFDKMTGNWIHQHRKKAGLSQLDLAKIVGLSQQHLAHVESGNRSIGLRGLMKMRCALNFTLSEFEAYMDNPGAEIAAATLDDITNIQNLNVHLSEKALIAAIQEQQVYVIKLPWVLVGVCFFCTFQQEPFLTAMYVDPDYCKQGYYKNLVTFWENAMQEQGYESVLVTTPESSNAKYFFEKIGYQYVGFVQTKTRDGEELMYRKYLTAQS